MSKNPYLFATVYFCEPLSGTQLAIGEICWSGSTDECVGWKSVSPERQEATLVFLDHLYGANGYHRHENAIYNEMVQRAAKPASYWIRKDQYPSINQISCPQPGLYDDDDAAMARLGRDWK